MAERRAGLRDAIRAADDPDRLWPVNDLADALGLIVVTRKRLVDHFGKVGKEQIGLRELMDMSLDAPGEGFMDFMMSPLLRVHGVGKKGFWSVVNGLTVDLGPLCNQERKKRLAQIQRKYW